MKILIPGGSGHLGQLLTQHLEQRGHEVVVLSRTRRDDALVVEWDGRTLGSWAGEVDGADAVINLAGRSVNCRYSKAHLTEMLTSRVDSTRAVGMAIAQATHPPRVWLQASTATIYAHTFDRPNDEVTGRIGGDEPGVPAYWRFSVEIAKAWEEALLQARTPQTRKVALRTAMAMSAEPGGVFDLLCSLARWGLGGSIAGGEQFISWVHEQDFVRAIDFLLDRHDLEGPINIASPVPLPQRAFMAVLRTVLSAPIGLHATRWMAEVGALMMRTDTELDLKSRRVVPRRLLEAGFTFEFPEWPEAARELVARTRK